MRWKAPQAPDPSDEAFNAGEFGLAELQAYSPSEVAGTMPVLFWIHGGSYSYGGTVDPLYDGKGLIEDTPDVIFLRTTTLALRML